MRGRAQVAELGFVVRVPPEKATPLPAEPHASAYILGMFSPSHSLSHSATRFLVGPVN